jgi:oligopeptide/dipeptide ABC transporter ATP-binding protein
LDGSSIRFEGREILAMNEREIRSVRGGRIAMVFQEPMTSLNPVFSIGTQIIEAINQHKKPSAGMARKRALELLELVGISDPERRLKQYPHQLSGGMRQRVMIALALSCDPRIIIADEPTTALDVTIQAQILELMRSLTKKFGVSLILITHNLGVVARYAERVMVMYAGRIVEEGPVAQIFSAPRHPYTIGLLRSIPRMDKSGRERLRPIKGQPPDLSMLGPGCSYADRCEWVDGRCGQAVPPLEAVEELQAAACYRKFENLAERAG